ncbi:MAG: DUF2911 domain-containing protein [Rhodothermales bacterium]|nr:DUF2911 domain-containing protein [Rhodothermales bacterium]
MKSHCLAATLVLFLLAPDTGSAQIVASEKGSVTQTIDGTTITVRYSRPTLRGRTNVFGSSTVPDSVLWTPGADNATTIEIDKDIRLGGADVPAGTYTVWMVVGPEEWEVILDPRDDLFHLPHPARSDSQIVFTAVPDTTRRQMESLQFSFPAVRSNGADLEMWWERTSVSMPIEVTPSRVLTISEEDARPYFGRYQVTVPAQEEMQMEAFEFEMTLEMVDGHLGGEFGLGGMWVPEMTYFAPAASQVFTPVFTMNGEVAVVGEGMFMEFTLNEAGEAASFELRWGEEDSLMASGVRIE